MKNSTVRKIAVNDIQDPQLWKTGPAEGMCGQCIRTGWQYHRGGNMGKATIMQYKQYK